MLGSVLCSLEKVRIQHKGLSDEEGRVQVSGAREKAGIYPGRTDGTGFDPQPGYLVQVVPLAKERKALGVHRRERVQADEHQRAQQCALLRQRLNPCIAYLDTPRQI